MSSALQESLGLQLLAQNPSSSEEEEEEDPAPAKRARKLNSGEGMVQPTVISNWNAPPFQSTLPAAAALTWTPSTAPC